MKLFLYLISFIILVSAPFLGEIALSLEGIFDSSSTSFTIFWDLRVSRVVLAFFDIVLILKFPN